MLPTSQSQSQPAASAGACADVTLSWWTRVSHQVRGWRRLGLRDQLGRLTDREGELLEMIAELEKKFLAIGGALQNQAEVAGNLVTQGSQLMVAWNGTDEEKPAVGEATALLAHLLTLLESDTRRAADLLAGMERYHDQIGRLLTEEHSVERIVAPLRIIQTLFRIEATLLPPEVQSAFIALSGEIPRFEQKVRDAFTSHTEVLTQAGARIETTIARLRAEAERQGAGLKLTKARVDAMCATLAQEHERCAERFHRLESLLREIDRHAGDMVVGLQFQDITRQKLEHVLASVRDLAARRSTIDFAHVHHSCRLEMLQAEAIRTDLRGAIERIEAGARAMSEAMTCIERECWSRNEFSMRVAATEGRVKLLREALSGVAEELPRASTEVGAAVDLLQSLGDVAATVASTASEMAEDMRMIALNAQVQAAQAGEAGAGLLILAERTYLISEEIKLVTRSIGTEFHDAARQLDDALACGQALRQQLAQELAETESSTRHINGRLDIYRDETVHSMEQIRDLLQRLAQGADQIRPALQQVGECLDPLDGLRGELSTIATATRAFTDHPAANAQMASLLAATKSRYTMDTERAVHHAALGGVAPAAAVPALAEAVAAPSASGGGDNVELF